MWAVGFYANNGAAQTLVEHWDGNTWSVVPSPNAGTNLNKLQGISALTANDVWAVGFYFYSNAGIEQTLVEHWDGTAWSVVPSPNVGTNLNRLYGVAAVSSNDIWAGGYFYYYYGDSLRPLTEHYASPCTPTLTTTPTIT